MLGRALSLSAPSCITQGGQGREMHVVIKGRFAGRCQRVKRVRCGDRGDQRPLSPATALHVDVCLCCTLSCALAVCRMSGLADLCGSLSLDSPMMAVLFTFALVAWLALQSGPLACPEDPTRSHHGTLSNTGEGEGEREVDTTLANSSAHAWRFCLPHPRCMEQRVNNVGAFLAGMEASFLAFAARRARHAKPCVS